MDDIIQTESDTRLENVRQAVESYVGNTQMRPKKMQGLTTGEVSRMLGVSILTDERFFDKGILPGWKHPMTGWKAVDPGSDQVPQDHQDHQAETGTQAKSSV